MFLKSLIIDNNGSLIRDISFHKGINLIVDETPENSTKQASGNNVGKTTVLRLIDFCLGGDGKNIYHDTEFKAKTNTTIENFLKENNIVITLTLIEDIDDETSDEIQIKRNFLSYGRKIQMINGEKYGNNADFTTKLNQLIFKKNQDKPTFRQIIAKNIRDEKSKLNNTLKVLHSTTRFEEYEALYLYWLGIETNTSERKEELVRQRTIEKKLQERLKKENNLSQINQSIIIIDRTIEELNAKKDTFNINDNFNLDLSELNQVKSEINRCSTELGRLEMRKQLIEESKQDLESEVANIDVKQIRSLYEKAKFLIPSIQISFEQTITFHNEMIAEKVKYIAKEAPQIERRITKLKKDISNLLINEKKLSIKLNKSGAVNELQSLILLLNKQYEKKGRLEEQKRLWETSTEKIISIDKELSEINNGINSKEEIIQKRIAEFNKYFSEISYLLYGERFVLSSDKNDRAYELNITSIEGNLGTGKKKGQIAAFDFAYILFAEALQIPCLHFILHDQIENIHDNQIYTLVELASTIHCQYITPILRDKIPEDINIEAYEIISLSQSEKLFKLP